MRRRIPTSSTRPRHQLLLSAPAVLLAAAAAESGAPPPFANAWPQRVQGGTTSVKLQRRRGVVRVVWVNPNPNPKCRVLFILSKNRVGVFETRNLENPKNPTQNFRVARTPRPNRREVERMAGGAGGCW